MAKQKRTDPNIESPMDMPSSKDGAIRQRARKSLVDQGKPAVSSLTQVLQNSELDYVRWEAAKMIGALDDSRAIPSLVRTLEDSEADVAWLAAEASRKFKKAAWRPLLRV